MRESIVDFATGTGAFLSLFVTFYALGKLTQTLGVSGDGVAVTFLQGFAIVVLSGVAVAASVFIFIVLSTLGSILRGTHSP